MADTNGNGRINWQAIAVWCALAVLSIFVYVVEQTSARLDRQIEVLGANVVSDHDDVVRLREIVPRVEERLRAIEQQNAEILRELRKQ